MIHLEHGPARLTIAQRGAEPLAWSIDGVPVIWTPDPAVWPQTAPILFPVVGWTRGGKIRHAGVSYPLGLHGFASGRVFQIVEAAADEARLRLEADAETQAKYPFDFRLDAIYRLEADALVWALEVTNCGDAPMPYAVGIHPGFCWPFAGSRVAHAFEFDAPESADVPVIAPGGLFSQERRAIPLQPIDAPHGPRPAPLWGAAAASPTQAGRGRRLSLTSDLMAQEALCFLDIASRGAVYDNGSGTRLRVELDDFPHIALWARPPAQFLCIEAWTGHGDPVGFEGEIGDKPSMRRLAPGAAARHSARFSFETDAPPSASLGAAPPV